MAWAHVQSVQSSGSGTTATVTITAAGSGNLLVYHLKLGGTRSLTVTDNATTPNTYAQAGSVAGTAEYMYYGVQTTGGATQAKITWTTTISWRMTVDEFSGGAASNAAIFDNAAINNSASGTSASAKLIVANAGELIVGGCLLNATSGVTAGTNYLLGINNVSQSTLYRLSGNTNFETVPISWTGSGTWAMVAAAFKPASPPQTIGDFMEYI